MATSINDLLNLKFRIVQNVNVVIPTAKNIAWKTMHLFSNIFLSEQCSVYTA